MQKDINLSLAKMISTNGIEEQWSNITNWLNQQYHLSGIGIFLRDLQSTQTYFPTETVSKDVVHKLKDMLLKISQTEEAEKGVLFFSQQEERFITFSPREYPDTPEPVGIAVPLNVQGRSVGTLALFADSKMIQGIKTDPKVELSFVPLVSNLLDNAVSHELKDNKIRMLNLYQTVSSSLAYIGDLQELLATITAIVTSELLCEESSVLLYDEDSNEFEFFTAFGETGMMLVSERFPADRGIAGRALRERVTQVVNDVQSDPDFYGNIDKDHDFKTRSIVAAPLISGDEPVGVINALNKGGNNFFDKEDDQILSAIADEVAMAVKNARLFEYVVESYCKIKQGANSCKGCKRPLKSWTPCVRQLELL